ncbi:hypothetical protein ABB37_04740 [Leptomonas pyrrhocoris]|uniref:Uncharacterized protein n=1 Tax=Leptomonas pyrrhocoris TaxID=157538 RepID=A0A0M9G1K5_LEPPY|nr:hypothetical protein ABB37_04740 [Leptomonas pyrrhocoris]KPA80530.1 hypothetical protein ABB37_04740 [Leptomonas pyrrhocoris]|eukprot:XP_015658969.1 hypothetical protein ABB37_04740 [Leptomonas pyrrhocoris]
MTSTALSTGTPAQSWSGAARRTYPPSTCAFNPTCTVAVVSTIAGVRPFELVEASAAANRHGPIAQSLMRPRPAQHETHGSSAAHLALSGAAAAHPQSAAASNALWATPVYAATVAGESALVAVVFRARPAVFLVPTHTVAAAERPPPTQEKDDAPTLPTHRPLAQDADADPVPDREDGEDVGATSGCGNGPSSPSSPVDADRSTSAELFAAEAEYRRYVYLFDATTGLCLAALHFCGSPVLALRANAAVLLVIAADLFHVVELDALHYVRQQSTYKPPNPRAILDLSSAVAVKAKKAPLPRAVAKDQPQCSGSRHFPPQYSYAIAFPQSARGYRGDVTVLTLHTTPRPSPSPSPSQEPSHASQNLRNGDAAIASSSPAAVPDAPPSMQQRTIAAHHHAIAHLRLRHDGRLLVTASELGSTLKLFDCATGSLLAELQRGHRPASVLSLGLQHDAYRVAALSTNGTLHVFNCAAVVQSWEAGRRWPVTTPTTATGFSYSSSSSAMNKTRADYKMKVPPLHGKDARHLVARAKGVIGTSVSPTPADATAAAAAAVNLPSDGSIHYDVGFTANGRTVWVAQVESIDAQLAFDGRQNTAAAAAAVATGATRSDEPYRVRQSLQFAGHQKRCVGRLTRFPVLPPGRTGAADVEVEGVSFSIEV